MQIRGNQIKIRPMITNNSSSIADLTNNFRVTDQITGKSIRQIRKFKAARRTKSDYAAMQINSDPCISYDRFRFKLKANSVMSDAGLI